LEVGPKTWATWAAPLALLGLELCGSLVGTLHLGSFQLAIAVCIELLDQAGLKIVIASPDQPSLGALTGLHSSGFFLFVERPVAIRVELTQDVGFELPFPSSLLTRFLCCVGIIALFARQLAIAVGVKLGQDFFPSGAPLCFGLVFLPAAFGQSGFHRGALLLVELAVSVGIELRQHLFLHLRARRRSARTIGLFPFDGGGTILGAPLFGLHRTG
jgi:hypothetical protein